MTAAPSSPVPAVEACPDCPDMGYGVYSDRCPNCPVKAQIDSVTEPTSAAVEEEGLLAKLERLLLLPEWPNEKAWFEAVETAHALASTPTPGRAAEPDTMGEVGPRSGRAASELEQALAREAAADARADAAAAENDSLRTRAETAEAQLATLRAEPFGLGECIRIAKRGFDAWAAKDHNRRWFRKIDGTPIPNDLSVNIAEAFADALSNPKADR